MKSKKGKEMLTFTDWYYQESKIMQSILDTQGIEIDAVRDKLKDILNQFYVDTATWGLDLWEKELNIQDTSGDYAERRNRIKLYLAKPVSVTPQFLCTLTNRYLNDKSATIIEHIQDYCFDVCFNNGSLFDWAGLQKAIEIYKPAHLGVKYFALQNVSSSIYVSGAVNNIEQIEIGVEEDYSIDPVTAPIVIYGISNIAEQIEIGADNVIEDTNINVDTDNVIYGLFDVVDQIEI